MEDLLRRQLFGDNTPPAPIGGEKSDAQMHPVEELVFREQYHIAPPSNIPAPVRKKILSVEEVEEFLAKRRRTALIDKHADFLAGARKSIRTAVIADAIEDYPQHADKLRLL